MRSRCDAAPRRRRRPARAARRAPRRPDRRRTRRARTSPCRPRRRASASAQRRRPPPRRRRAISGSRRKPRRRSRSARRRRAPRRATRAFTVSTEMTASGMFASQRAIDGHHAPQLLVRVDTASRALRPRRLSADVDDVRAFGDAASPRARAPRSTEKKLAAVAEAVGRDVHDAHDERAVERQRAAADCHDVPGHAGRRYHLPAEDTRSGRRASSMRRRPIRRAPARHSIDRISPLTPATAPVRRGAAGCGAARCTGRRRRRGAGSA